MTDGGKQSGALIGRLDLLSLALTHGQLQHPDEDPKYLNHRDGGRDGGGVRRKCRECRSVHHQWRGLAATAAKRTWRTLSLGRTGLRSCGPPVDISA
jgi:hypothetical protein